MTDTTETTVETQPKAVIVTAVKQGWNHQGKDVAIGEKVSVTPEQAKMLRAEQFVK